MSIPKSDKTSRLSWLLRLAVTIICLAFLWHLVDIDYIVKMVSTVRLGYLLAAAIFYMAAPLGGGFVWLYLLRSLGDKNLTFWGTMRLILLGFVFNNLIPGGVAGDVYRVMGAMRYRVSAARAATTVVLERWTSLLALFLATIVADLWALPLLHSASLDHNWAPQWIPDLAFRFDILMSATLIALLIGFLGISATLWRAVQKREDAPQRLRKEANYLGAKWQDFQEELALFNSSKQRRTLLIASLINTSSPFLEGISFALVAKALGLDLSPFLFLAFTPIFRIVSHLPISVNAIGPQEFVSLLLWEPLGATYSDAVTISLIIHALKILLSILCLPMLLVIPNDNPNEPTADRLDL